MRCYFWEQGILQEGIPVQDRDDNWVVPLGDAPDTRRIRYVPLHHYNPPEIVESGGDLRIYDAYPVGKKVSDPSAKTFFVLAKPYAKHQDDPRTLVQVSTRANFPEESRFGGWLSYDGSVELIKEGVRRGDRDGLWRVGVFRLAPGAVLRVATSGVENGDFALYMEEDRLKTEDWSCYQDRRISSSIRGR